MAPLQRRFEGGLRQTLSVLLGSAVSELAWCGRSSQRVLEVSASGYWSAVDLHKAVMSNICIALRRPLLETHPEEATALAAKADLLATGVAVDEYAKVMIENDASKLYEARPRATDKRAAEIVRPAPVQADDRVPPKNLTPQTSRVQMRSLTAWVLAV